MLFSGIIFSGAGRAAAQNRHGFTLIEIMAVMSVIAITGAFGLAALQNARPNLSLNAEARDLVSDLRLTQQMSVTEQTNYSIIFDQAQNRYTLINISSGQVIKTKALSAPTFLAAVSGLTDNTVKFNATGAALESGEIILQNHQGRQIIIEIKPSGYVKMQK